jgi:IclR family KDG regulon transcriptional repressor
MNEINKSLNHVKSIQKAFLIIEELDKSGELSIGDISLQLGMNKATVHRILQTIKDAGFINQNRETKKYSNSFKLLAMGSRVMQKTGLKEIARPYVEVLADRTGETVNLGILTEGSIIYIDKIESRSTIKVGLGIGTSVPIYCSGLGKAILSYLPDADKESLIEDLQYIKYTDKTITNKSWFLEELQKSRQRQYTVDDEEYVDGLICFGAPIFDYHGIPVAAISVSCPKYRYEEDRDLSKYTSLLLEAAHEISRQFGHKLSDGKDKTERASNQ